MKKYLVIGNPIEHSLSPIVHNYWMKKYHLIDCVYEKKKIDEKELSNIVKKIRDSEIVGMNITVPFKKLIIPFLRWDTLSQVAPCKSHIWFHRNKKASAWVQSFP